jgi:hypothetical protein
VAHPLAATTKESAAKFGFIPGMSQILNFPDLRDRYRSPFLKRQENYSEYVKTPAAAGV